MTPAEPVELIQSQAASCIAEVRHAIEQSLILVEQSRKLLEKIRAASEHSPKASAADPSAADATAELTERR